MGRFRAGAVFGYLSPASLEGPFQFFSQVFILRAMEGNIFEVLVLTEGNDKRIHVCLSRAISKATEKVYVLRAVFHSCFFFFFFRYFPP